ncbi:PH domain-containing protein [Jatrophihabitans sp.]|uniref:PH domain-containing protein n=1 Tax=Jatrophihabitans sp. TaxID=1932789 RepID=UPI002B85CDC0|nr:PH domain-containing protein [Jatrophihabitans sp.]
MAAGGTDRPALEAEAPLSVRVPPYQPALLMLVVCAAAALVLYGHPSDTVRYLALTAGAVALLLAVFALRMYLIADDEGIEVRYLWKPAWLPWSQVARVEVVSGVRGSDTVRVVRHDGSYVDVPPSLLQPAVPTSKPRALARLHSVGNQIEARRIRGSRHDRY